MGRGFPGSILRTTKSVLSLAERLTDTRTARCSATIFAMSLGAGSGARRTPESPREKMAFEGCGLGPDVTLALGLPGEADGDGVDAAIVAELRAAEALPATD